MTKLPTRGRVYRSRRQRPCDFCRKRKTCCIIDGEPPCAICQKRGLPCTFSVNVKPARKRQKSTNSPKGPKIRFYQPDKAKRPLPDSLNEPPVQAIATETVNFLPVDPLANGDTSTPNPVKNVPESVPLPPALSIDNLLQVSSMDSETSDPNSSTDDSRMGKPTYEFDLPLTFDIWNLLFKDFQDESIDGDIQKCYRSTETINAPSEVNADPLHLPVQANPSTANRFKIPTLSEIRQHNRGSVDSDETIKAQFLTDNSYIDPFLYISVTGLPIAGSLEGPTDTAVRATLDEPCGVDPNPQVFTRELSRITGAGSSIPPLIVVQRDPGIDERDRAAKATIKSAIGFGNGVGPHLLLLYFQHIHPFLPCFSRGLFYFGRNQNMLDFRNSMLSTLLAVAMDKWDQDEVLQEHPRPSDELICKIASSAIMAEQTTPNYTTLQAAVLLSQKRPQDSTKPDTPLIWSILGLASSMASSMGYNHDCIHWQIPNWNKRLRRRIWWSFIVQDTWFALAYGRPLHIPKKYWSVTHLTSNDFEPYHMTKRETEKFHLSVTSFCYLTHLTEAVADISEDLVSHNERDYSFETSYAVGMTFMNKISYIESDCPHTVKLGYEKDQSNSANGSIQLAILAAKLIILKYLLHRMILSGQKASEVHRRTLYNRSLDCLRSCVEFVEDMNPKHFQQFWYSWSHLHFALIATFAILLYSISSSSTSQVRVRELIDRYWLWLRCNKSQFPDIILASTLIDNAFINGVGGLS